MTDTTPELRIEKDSMGEITVPAGAYYGASSERARQNFPISGRGFPREFISALGMVKKAAAEVNLELGLLDARSAGAIAAAAQEVVDGRLDEHFVIDVYQTGSGTSTNTNANEVIANRASELLGGPIGPGRLIHPNDQVNLCQSSNDVIPTAMQLACALEIHTVLRPGLQRLQAALTAKSEEFWPLVKTGRTHLQDATPVRLGQEFLGYAGQIEESGRRGKQALDELVCLPIGGTAVGTGINAHPEFGTRVAAKLAEWTGLKFRETSNHFHAQASLDVLVAAHALLRTIGVSLWKIASDVRLMGMGPTAGLFELRLPEVQPGSSIMPGKVNPVIVESLTMAVARVLGNDATVVLAGQSGSFFELNVMMPVAAVATLESIGLLGRSAANFAERCVEGLEATERGPALLEKNPILATALNPLLGYDESGKIAKEAFRTGRTIRELARERGLSDEQIDAVLDPAAMTKPGLEGPGGGG